MKMTNPGDALGTCYVIDSGSHHSQARQSRKQETHPDTALGTLQVPLVR